MPSVLLVDDDAVVLKLYQDGLTRRGFQVDTAADGLAAVQALRAGKPDVVVLDLMMPKLSGVDVLKFIRGQLHLAALPVVVLSNVYLTGLAEQAAAIGVQQSLLKMRCSPAILADLLHNLLAGPDRAPSAAPASPSPAAAASPGAPDAGSPQTAEDPARAEMSAKARQSFLEHVPATRGALRALWLAFTEAGEPLVRAARLEDLYRKVHFVTATAGLAHCHRLARLASVFEALLFEVLHAPALLSPSVQRTAAFAVDFLDTLLADAPDAAPDTPLVAQALVVDDDALSNRLAIAALRLAGLEARSTEDPRAALQWLRETQFDLVLLDIEMPDLDGFELCRELRRMPGYERTPVIYVTVHSDFESRAQSVMSGGDDLISKPVFPVELAVKVVAHLLRARLAGPPAGP